jgi:hypothetical protein
MTTVFITKIVDLTKITDTCCNCGADCAPANSIEVDPICTACAHTILAETHLIPLPALHDFAFALREPAAAMPTNDDSYAPHDFDADPADLPEAQGLWRF